MWILNFCTLNTILKLNFFHLHHVCNFLLKNQYFIDSAFVSYGPIVIPRPPKTEETFRMPAIVLFTF
jgi:hypothetical protein